MALAWNVRGDAGSSAFAATVQQLLSLALPTQPNTSTSADDAALLLLGPQSWLYVAEADSPRISFDDARRSLTAIGGALFDVSSSYVGWRVEGAAASRVVNRGCPLDLCEDAFPTGHCAQSAFGHMTVVVHRPDASRAFIVLASRSYARDVLHLLQMSALTEGYDAAADALR
ncbi:MAG TPA: sarcosine oxidase subunit gamma family protein [Casimicrobiaceae bacterium]|nr:sarcosine oxidase subunit gamma family protein [Casimicrobiaceae bacterium]